MTTTVKTIKVSGHERGWNPRIGRLLIQILHSVQHCHVSASPVPLRLLWHSLSWHTMFIFRNEYMRVCKSESVGVVIRVLKSRWVLEEAGLVRQLEEESACEFLIHPTLTVVASCQPLACYLYQQSLRNIPSFLNYPTTQHLPHSWNSPREGHPDYIADFTTKADPIYLPFNHKGRGVRLNNTPSFKALLREPTFITVLSRICGNGDTFHFGFVHIAYIFLFSRHCLKNRVAVD